MSTNTFTIDVRLTQDAESGWWVADVTQLPGCVSQGKTQAEAKSNALRAAAAYLAAKEAQA